jgi:hypothetical protein
VLCREQQNNFDHVITGDESWFFIHYPNESVWAGSRDEVPARIKQTIDTEKCLISVLWSANGIHSLVDNPTGESYNSSFFCCVIVPSLVEDICSGSRWRSLKGFYVHLDNARPPIRASPMTVYRAQKPAGRRDCERCRKKSCYPG